jgi:hypothetical protein
LRPIVYKEMVEKSKAGGTFGGSDPMSFAVRGLAKYTYVSCWHMNEHESAAMWKLYAKTSEAIAIRSTYLQLFESLPARHYVGCVSYIDYEQDWLPEGNLMYPFMHKRKSFEHEHELRALMQIIPTKDRHLDFSQPSDLGHVVPVEMDSLVEEVYVAPDCPSWFFQLVQEVSAKFELRKPIVQSSLNAAPFY